MAQGDIHWFADALVALGNGKFNLSTDVLKIGIVNNTTAPVVGTAVPHWGGTGTTNFATNQVAVTGTSYTGPKVLTTVTWADFGRVGPKLRADIVNLAQDAAGFTNGAYGVIYDDTNANKLALGWVELSSTGAESLVAGPVSIDWNGATNDILAITAA